MFGVANIEEIEEVTVEDIGSGELESVEETAETECCLSSLAFL